MKNHHITTRVIVIGRSRQGKSFLGNAIADADPTYKDEKEFYQEQAGHHSCTEEIKSGQWTVSKDNVHYHIEYIDTPGFPDTRGPEETVETYNKIVEYINTHKPDVIIWMLNPTSRNIDDIEMYKTYSILMKEFVKSNIHCAVLVNTQESKKVLRNEGKRFEAMLNIQDQIKDYGIDVFTQDDAYISLHEDEIKDILLIIVAKAKALDRKDATYPMKSFVDLEKMFTDEFDSAKQKVNYIKDKQGEKLNAEADVEWHNTVLKFGSFAEKAAEVLDDAFSLSPEIAAIMRLSKLGSNALVESSKAKIVALEEKIGLLNDEIKNVDEDRIKSHAKEMLSEFIAILEVMKQPEKISNLKRKFPKILQD